MGGVPARAPGAGAGRRALPRLRRPRAARRRAARRGATGAPPDLDDWLVLLEDYALRCLRPRSGARGGRRATTRSPPRCAQLGFRLTRRGIRRGTSEVDRLLTGSQAKAIGLVEVLGGGDGVARRRACARSCCATPSSPSRARPALGGVLDPAAGTARHALIAVAADVAHGAAAPAARVRPRAALPARPTPTCCSRRSARRPRTQLALPDWEAEPDGVLVSLALVGRRSGCRARWVELATRVLDERRDAARWSARARCSARAGTARRSTASSTSRSPRPACRCSRCAGARCAWIPADPEKIASNWDVVCVAPDLARGSADYERFVRKHLHLYAPAEDGEIEAGPSHVHPELGPVRAAARGPARRAQPRDAPARRRARRGARALADR